MSQNTEKTWFAFVIMPFDPEFDVIYNDLIVPPLRSAGYEVHRADSNPHQQNILKSIIEGISKADLIIAELTSLNANVMYELGVAHTLSKPTIMLTQDMNEIPFDLRSYVQNEYSENYRSAETLKNRISEIAQQHKSGQIQFGNPVSDFAPDAIQHGISASQLSDSIQLISSFDDDNVEELGTLDYAVEVENAIGELGQYMAQMLELTTEIGQKINSRAAELQYIGGLATRGVQQPVSHRQKIVNFAASDIRHFANSMNNILPNFRTAWSKLDTNLESLLTTSVVRTEEDRNSVINFGLQIEGMKVAFDSTGNDIKQFRDVLVKLPNASRELTRAGHIAVDALNKIINEFQEDRTSLDKFGPMLEQLLDNDQSDFQQA